MFFKQSPSAVTTKKHELCCEIGDIAQPDRVAEMIDFRLIQYT